MSCVSFLPHQLSLLVLLLTQTRNEFEPPGPINGKCWRLTTQSYFIKEKQGQVYLATAIAYWLACWAAMAFTCLSWEGDIWVQDGCQQCMTELRFHELKKKKKISWIIVSYASDIFSVSWLFGALCIYSISWTLSVFLIQLLLSVYIHTYVLYLLYPFNMSYRFSTSVYGLNILWVSYICLIFCLL